MLHGHGDEAGCRLRTARDDEAEGAPEVHTVAAWETYGCSLAGLRLRAIAAWQTYGYIRLQPGRPTVAAWQTYGYVRLQPGRPTVAAWV